MKLPARRSLLAAAGIAAVVVGLLVNFPARLALAWFAPPGIRAMGVEGTVWQGRAAEITVRGDSLGAVSWDARTGRFLVLRPSWDLELRRADGFATMRFSTSLTGSRQTFSGVEAALALHTLPRAIVPEGVAGELSATFERLELNRGWPSGIAGRAAVAQLRLPGVILTLGPFEFFFPDQSGPPVAEVRSLGGPLAVDGRLELPGHRQWDFTAELAPGENPPRELIDGLAFVGEDIGGGKRRLTISSGH
jgi:general secretion pathway protein N